MTPVKSEVQILQEQVEVWKRAVITLGSTVLGPKQCRELVEGETQEEGEAVAAKAVLSAVNDCFNELGRELKMGAEVQIGLMNRVKELEAHLAEVKGNGKSTTTGNNRYANGNLYTSTDGGSSVAIAARGAGSGSGNLWDFETTAIFIFDVTNTSTHKVQMGYEFEGSTSIYGGTNDSQTCVTFIRLGDT